ncbi:MAG: hypothetical protein ACTHX2_13740, partial [Microbacterium sp.]
MDAPIAIMAAAAAETGGRDAGVDPGRPAEVRRIAAWLANQRRTAAGLRQGWTEQRAARLDQGIPGWRDGVPRRRRDE